VKPAASAVGEFLRRPPVDLRAALFFGPDSGLVRERADQLARAVCPDLADPFRVVELSASLLAGDPVRLADEAAQLSLVPGRRVMRLREAADALAPLFAGFLEHGTGEALVVVEAGELPARSSLRRLFEEAKSAAAIGCYPDDARELLTLVRETLAAHDIRASRDAVQYLVEHLGGDRLLTRSELEKLTLYAGEGGAVDLAEVEAAIGDSALLSLDQAVLATAEGDVPALDRALARVFEEGGSPVTAIRALLRHLHRLYGLLAEIEAGKSLEQVLRGARPPIFFRQQESFRRQLQRWNAARLRPALGLVGEAEFRMKQTGMPAQTICRAAMLDLAQTAKGRLSPR
jgi:DNA polymerase-3 subunit delta